MAIISMVNLLENLEQLMNGDLPSTLVEKDEIEYLYEELQFLWSFVVKESEENLYAHDKVKNLVTRIRDVADEAEVIINWVLLNALEQRDGRRAESTSQDFDLSPDLYGVKKQIKSIRTELEDIQDNTIYDIGFVRDGNSYDGGSSRANTPVLEEVVVGFDGEAEAIKERLAGAQRHLEVISIVGMGGLGKTTLARKVYNDPFIGYHFHVRAWTYVSQVYQKRAVLLGILSCLVEDKDQIANNWSAEMMEEKVYRCLKRKRYLIVVDDIWNVKAWNDLSNCFPNDNNGSRILFTTRHMDVALYPRHNRIHPLRFLNENESWNLIERKVFGEERCSPELVEIGKQIAEKCQGLPLPIVVLAGILAKEKTQDWWKQVAKHVSSFILSDPKQIMDTFALSYSHLPYFLKPCFLYFGLFPQNYEIPVKKLILLWVAEGFINKIGQECLEDVAKVYLTNLIDKNLVLIAQRGSNGGIKACRLHDLLHDFCLKKSEEENFLKHICRYDQVASSSSSSSIPICNKQRRLGFRANYFNDISLMPSAPHLCSFLCFASEFNYNFFSEKITSFICQALKLLRVLDLYSISISSFPSELVQLVLLRYLALDIKDGSLPSSVSNLRNLETLILARGMIIPSSIWKIVKLRHLLIREMENYIENSSEAHTGNGNPSILDNLQTISQVSLTPSLWDILSRTPNLRKLGICGPSSTAFPDLHFLNHLETLRLALIPLGSGPINLGNIQLPQNLKKLTLSFTALGWSQLSTIGMLPNLEVLKLLFDACVGPKWETRDGGFLRLKFLQFVFVFIEEWSTDSSHFPSLERLKLTRCTMLGEIPSELGYIPTLQMIEVIHCSHSAAKSARRMKEEQHEMGNDELKIHII